MLSFGSGQKKRPSRKKSEKERFARRGMFYLLSGFSQTWLPTVQDVLQADWQDAWHSPHPVWFASVRSAAPLIVSMCFMFTLRSLRPFYRV